MYFVYILKHSKTNQVYIGKTSDIKRRLSEHNSGNQISTRRQSGEWKLVYAELYKEKVDADEREKKLKQHGR
jgi:putative endonuclease